MNDFNPFQVDPGLSGHPSQRKVVSPLVVRARSLLFPTILMISAVSFFFFCGMLAFIVGIFVAIAYVLIIVIPCSLAAACLSAVTHPQGLTKQEARRLGLSIGFVSASMVCLIWHALFRTHPAALLLQLLFVTTQSLAGGFGARCGFDHIVNLAILGRPGVWGVQLWNRNADGDS